MSYFTFAVHLLDDHSHTQNTKHTCVVCSGCTLKRDPDLSSTPNHKS